MSESIQFLDEYINSSIPKYRSVGYLKQYYDFDDNEELVNSFLSETKLFTDTFLNLLVDLSNKIKDLIPEVKLTLKLIEGDYFHENLLGIYVKVPSLEDSYKLDKLQESLYDHYNDWDLDMIHLSLEF